MGVGDVGGEVEIGLEAAFELCQQDTRSPERGEEIEVGMLVLEGVGEGVEAGAEVGGGGDTDLRRRLRRPRRGVVLTFSWAIPSIAPGGA